MCGRFGLFASADQIEERFGLEAGSFHWAPRYNIAPTQPVLAVGGERGVRTLRWGLVPAHTPPGRRAGRTTPAHGREWINARVETVATKQAFRSAFAIGRCLVAASGYFEWEGEEPAPADREFRLTPPSARRPHWHQVRGAPVIALAGITALWKPEPDLDAIESCAIVTAPAAPALASIHTRMPLVVPGGREDDWLGAAPDQTALEVLVGASCALAWTEHLVPDTVNSPHHEGAALVDPR